MYEPPLHRNENLPELHALIQERVFGLLISNGAEGLVVSDLARAMAARGEDRAGDRPARILVVLADAGHKYLSKIFNDDWMREKGFLEGVKRFFAGDGEAT